MWHSIKKLVWLDDRTGIPSTSKLMRLMTWVLASQFVIVSEVLIFLKWITLTPEEINLANIVKDFLIFFVPSVEASYQFNRHTKLVNGDAPLVQPEGQTPNV
jgi:hypothetical protein